MLHYRLVRRACVRVGSNSWVGRPRRWQFDRRTGPEWVCALLGYVTSTSTPGDREARDDTHPARVHLIVAFGRGDPVYVALGDSISIDDYAGGPGRGAASLLARNRDDDFPHWRGHDLATRHPSLRYHLLAVDGGTTQTLLDSQLPRLEASGLRPTVATLTVGGNDLLGAYGDTTRARAAVRTVIVCVGQVLTRLARLMNSTDDPIILGTVYDPSDGHADGAARLGLPPWPEVLDVLAELNDGLRAVAAQHRARIAEIHDRFLGHGLAIGNPAQPEPRPRNRGLWYCNVIEPNAWGADAVRASFWQALQQPG